MKPDWDKLMKKYRKSKTKLIADVDCTAEGKPLCDDFGVEGFPTIKYGDPSNLEDYEGGRDLKSLKKFAKALKPVCSAANLDLCDAEKKELMESFLKMDVSELENKIETFNKEIQEAKETFEKWQQELQDKYTRLQEEKKESIQAVKDKGLGEMKSALAFLKDSAKKEL